jgi:hypothetical protein
LTLCAGAHLTDGRHTACPFLLIPTRHPCPYCAPAVDGCQWHTATDNQV